jgi:hypothetical protein
MRRIGRGWEEKMVKQEEEEETDGNVEKET